MAFVECDLKFTEDKSKILSFLRNFFPDAEFSEENGFLKGETDLKKFKEVCSIQESFLILKQLEEEKEIKLDKIAMQAGKIALDERGPLGCVTVKE